MGQIQTTDPKVKTGKMTPLFVLPTTAGGTSGPGAYRSKYNLVLAFLGTPGEARDYLRELAALNAEIYSQDGRIAVVLTARIDQVRALKTELALPFPLLADEDGQTTARMLGGAKAALCVADRYGEIMSVDTAPSPADLPPASTALDWLFFIQSLCPE